MQTPNAIGTADDTCLATEADRSADMETIIEARGLAKRYTLGKENHVDALRGASLQIGAGEMVAIVGPSGSGKSTMMHILGCLDAPDAGEVWLGDRRVDDLGGRALTKVRRHELGFIFQG